jgi:hypothetical protein
VENYGTKYSPRFDLWDDPPRTAQKPIRWQKKPDKCGEIGKTWNYPEILRAPGRPWVPRITKNSIEKNSPKKCHLILVASITNIAGALL